MDLITINHLCKYFKIKNGFFNKIQYLKAVDDVSFAIRKGETFGLVGESGCGKTTLGRTLVNLYDSDDGEIIYKNVNLTALSKKALRAYKKDIQMIFQDPYSSLNSRMSVMEIIREPLRIHGELSKAEEDSRIIELLNLVGLSRSHGNRYPHEFSGGQRQRIGIARALAVEPEFIVCDEPTSALDVSIQAQVVNMLKEFQEKIGITYLFIAHDLSMIQYISHRVGVMYMGKIVEIGETMDLFNDPKHPYTKALLSAVPIADPDLSEKKQREILVGEVPNLMKLPKGCRFQSRCKYKMACCEEKEPELKDVSNEHRVACYYVEMST